MQAPHALAAAAAPFARFGLQLLLKSSCDCTTSRSSSRSIYKSDRVNNEKLENESRFLGGRQHAINADVLNTRDRMGKTPVFWAARKGRDLVVQDLVQAGAALDHSSSSGYTALMAAAAGGHEGIVLTLVRAGASVTARAPHSGSTALHLGSNFCILTPRSYFLDADINTPRNLALPPNGKQSPLLNRAVRAPNRVNVLGR